MKNIIAILLCCFIFTSLMSQNQTFTVKGNISGMQKGDTIIACREYLLPVENLTCDTIITGKNSFTYKKQNEGSGFYMLEYRPADKTKNERNRNLLLFLGKGTVKLKGDADHFSLAEKKGEDYDHKLVSRYIFLKDSLALVESNLYDRYEKAMKESDGNAMKETLLAISAGRPCPELDSLSVKLANESKDSEYGAALYLWNSSLAASEDMENRLQDLNPEIQQSYTGTQIRKILEMKKNTEPGAMAPDFTLTTADRDKVSLQDYKGKYLLIFHWGISKGCFQLNPEIEKLYYNFRSRGVEVLDFVHHGIIPNNNLAYTPDVYRQIHPLLYHPWKSIYISMPENQSISEKYNLTAMPLLILISPEGKIMARNYGNIGGIQRILGKALPQ